MEFHEGYRAHFYSWCQVMISLSMCLWCFVLALLAETRMRGVLTLYESQVSVKWDWELCLPTVQEFSSQRRHSEPSLFRPRYSAAYREGHRIEANEISGFSLPTQR